MTAPNDGGPAFPHFSLTPWNKQVITGGMSLRDWFAGQALAGYFAAPHTQHQNADNQETAAYLWSIADAMLVERTRVRQ